MNPTHRLFLTSLLAAVLTLGLASGAQAGDFAKLDSVVESTPGLYTVSVTSSFGGCAATYCGWFPIGYRYDSIKSCPATAEAANMDGDPFLNGAIMDTEGTETTTASVKSGNADFKICMYHFHEQAYHFAGELRTVTTPALGVGEAKKQVGKQLGKKFKSKYKNGHSKKIKCTIKLDTQAKCDVSWTYKKGKRTRKYKGRVGIEKQVDLIGTPFYLFNVSVN